MTPETLVAHYPVLAVLPVADLQALCAPEHRLQISAGTEIFTERQACPGFPLLLSGSIKVIKQAANGREIQLYRVLPGGSCIISSSCLLGNTQYNARGIAETDLSLLILPRAVFARCLVDSSAFRDFVFHLFAERIGELMALVEEVAFARLDQRLAKVLLARGDEVLHVTHQQLADELGSVREIVSRLLKGFAAQGLVLLGREQLTVQDRSGLARIAAAE